MRTTLDIEEPVLLAVRSIAGQTGKSMGRVVSELLAKALLRSPEAEIRNGIPILPRRASDSLATMEVVNALRDGDGP